MKVLNSFTMEASFAGANYGKHQGHHFSTVHLEEMGHWLCETLYEYCLPDQVAALATLSELEMLLPLRPVGEGDNVSEDAGGSSAGSDAAPSEDNDPKLQLKALARARKKKKTKMRRADAANTTRRARTASEEPTTTRSTRDRSNQGACLCA